MGQRFHQISSVELCVELSEFLENIFKMHIFQNCCTPKPTSLNLWFGEAHYHHLKHSTTILLYYFSQYNNFALTNIDMLIGADCQVGIGIGPLKIKITLTEVRATSQILLKIIAKFNNCKIFGSARYRSASYQVNWI